MSQMGKRIAAKVTSSPGRTALNITGGDNGKAATMPRQSVAGSVHGAMQTKNGGPSKVSGASYKRQTKTSSSYLPPANDKDAGSSDYKGSSKPNMKGID